MECCSLRASSPPGPAAESGLNVKIIPGGVNTSLEFLTEFTTNVQNLKSLLNKFSLPVHGPPLKFFGCGYAVLSYFVTSSPPHPISSSIILEGQNGNPSKDYSEER